MNIPKAIKIALAQREKNVMWLSKETGLSNPFLSLLLNHHRMGKVATMERIAVALDMPLSELIALGEEL